MSPRTFDQRQADKRRRLVLELELLERYDHLRQVQGYDYGAGQRAGELGRRRRELELDTWATTEGLELETATADELKAVWAKIAEPKIARVEREDYRRGTRSTRSTLRAWAALKAEVADLLMKATPTVHLLAGRFEHRPDAELVAFWNEGDGALSWLLELEDELERRGYVTRDAARLRRELVANPEREES